MVFEVLVRPAQPIVWIALIEQLCNQQFSRPHEVVRAVLHEGGEFEGVGHNLVIYFLHVVSVHLHEGVFPGQQLVQDRS